MQFESKQKRIMWTQCGLALVPDLVISAALSHVLDGGWLGFFFTFLGLQSLYLAIWVKNSIWSWVLFKLNGRRLLASSMEDYLRANRFPAPDDYEKSAEGYFYGIMSDDEQPTALRIKAATSFAELNSIASMGQIQSSMRFSMAYEDALENHKKSLSRAG